jgi:hypothetical protein
MNEQIDNITCEIDSLILDLMCPLRMSKTINQVAFTKLTQAMDRLQPLIDQETFVPKVLVGKLWFIFTSMLSEAEHAKDKREEIEILAWDIEERLRELFGPHFKA